MNSVKQKFPAAGAKEVVRELLLPLAPCALAGLNELEPWLKVAGSLRRRKAEVGDIEIVYVPREGKVRDGLFEKDGNLFDEALEDLIVRRIIAPRPNKNGQTAWGGKNKLAVHCASGIPVDFFATTVPCFWNYLVCRTGGKDNNIEIASSAHHRGLQWNPYHTGFEVVNAALANHALGRRDLTVRSHVVARSERDVFTLAGLEYLEPWERK